MGRGLTSALEVAALLTFALALSAISLYDRDDAPQIDPKIVQVTDVDQGHRNFGEIGVLGVEREFRMFMEEYGKEYGSREEYARRLRIFAKNMVRATEHQALDPTAVHGVTPFSDLSEEEFESMFTGVVGGAYEKGVVGTAEPLEVEGLPESYDWREKGAVTEVKMQVSIHNLFTEVGVD